MSAVNLVGRLFAERRVKRAYSVAFFDAGCATWLVVVIQSLDETYSTAVIQDEVVTPSKILTAHITDPGSDVQNQTLERVRHSCRPSDVPLLMVSQFSSCVCRTISKVRRRLTHS
jgi:hypothetical protein